jgi:hypothetical protein
MDELMLDFLGCREIPVVPVDLPDDGGDLHEIGSRTHNA